MVSSKSPKVAIDVVTSDGCTGCVACSDACSVEAVSVRVNGQGFYRPVIDRDKCTECGACTLHCPVIQALSTAPTRNEVVVYGGWSNDRHELRNSSSGGLAFALGASTIADGGVVVGCVMDDNLLPVHRLVETMEGVQSTQGSKYVPSRLLGTYKQAVSEALQGRRVLFTGTPCQVAAFETFLKPSFRENVITAEIVCYGVPSILAWQRHLSESFNGRVTGVNFRDKLTGWSNCCITYELDNGAIVRRQRSSDTFFAAFISTSVHQLRCHSCPFAKLPRSGDLTLGDFWGVPVPRHNERGVSVVLASTKRGAEALEGLRNTGAVTLFPSDLRTATASNPRLISCRPIAQAHPRRQEVLSRLIAGESLQSAIEDRSLHARTKRTLVRCMPAPIRTMATKTSQICKRAASLLRESRTPRSCSYATPVTAGEMAELKPKPIAGSQVSVIIPSYNYGHFIREAIDSLMAQTLRPAEIIVVDDGSTDNTIEVLRAYGDSVKIICQENAGAAAARNRGAAIAASDVIAFMDADDIWLPHKLERQMECLRVDPDIGIVSCGFVWVDANGHREIARVTESEEGFVASRMLHFREPVVCTSACMLLPRRLFQQFGGFDESLRTCEDWDFTFRVTRTHKLRFLPEILWKYRCHGSGLHESKYNAVSMRHAFQKAFATDIVAQLANPRDCWGRAHHQIASAFLNNREYARSIVYLALAISCRPACVFAPFRFGWHSAHATLKRILASDAV